MRQFIATIVICSLIFVDSAIVFAQTTTTFDPLSNVKDGAMIAQDVDAPSSGDITSAERDAVMLSNITMAVAGVAGYTYYKKCSDRMSAKIFAGAAALFVAAELLGKGNHKKGSDLELAIYKGNVEGQAAALKAAEEMTKKAAKEAHKKAQYTNLAAAGFTAAALMAGFETFKDKGIISPPGACTKVAGNDFKLKYQEEKDKGFGQNVPKKNEFSESSNFGRIDSASDSNINLKLPNDTKPLEDVIEIDKTTFPKKDLNFKLKSSGGKTNAPMYKMVQLKIKKIIETLLPISYAADAKVAETATKKTAESFFEKAEEKVLKSGVTRTVIFLAVAALAKTAADRFSSVGKKLDARAKRYGILRQALESQNSGITIKDGVPVEIQTPVEINTSDDTLKITPDTELICFTGTQNNLSADSTCACRASNSCAKMDLGTTFPVGTPGVIKNSAVALKDTGNALFNGDIKGASLSGSKLLGQNAALKKGVNDLDKKFKELSSGKVNLNKLSDEYKKDYENSLAKAKRAVVGSASGSLAGSTISAAIPTYSENFKKLDSPSSLSEDKKSVLGGEGNQKEASFGNFKFTSDSDVKNSKDEELKADEALSYGEGVEVDEFALGRDGNDITEDETQSIFRIITHRYYKTAFPLIFEEEKSF